MGTIRNYKKKAQFVRSQILDETERIIYANEEKIIQLNTEQIDNSLGADGLILSNNVRTAKGRKKYPGEYSPNTAGLSPGAILPKIEGTPYNFGLTGTFLSSFHVEMSADLTKVKIINTGTGAGEKKAFFEGYSNAFGGIVGLTVEHRQEVNYKILMPELQKFINKYL